MRPLTLVYSSDSPKNNEAAQEEKDSDAGWHQLDMFSSSRPDALVFTSPQNFDFEELKEMLDSAHIKYILDLRVIPNLVFNGTSRGRFFQLLAQRDVDYISQMSVAPGARDKANEIADWLGTRIGRGPTMVFSDLDPQRDSEVRQLSCQLNQAGVKFEPVYLSIDDSRSGDTDLIAM